MHNVSTEEMMMTRDKRVSKQNKLISEHRTVICFTMNIAGPVKNNHLIAKAFNEGVNMLLDQLSVSGIECSHKEIYSLSTGPEGYFCCEADPYLVKQLMISLEDLNKFTRLFDIDVLTFKNYKVSRSDLNIAPRKCMLCDNEASVCARSRKHSVNKLFSHYNNVINNYFLSKNFATITANAIQSLLFEVTISPKPGLVDRFDNGAHKDMDIFTFIKSSCALIEPFNLYLDAGSKHSLDQHKDLMKQLRTIGRSCEATLLKATKNINTHKGANFSFGLFLGAMGCLLKNKNALSWQDVQTMIENLMQADSFQHRPDSYGKKLESNYQIGGIIKEALNGYSSVFKLSLPLFKQCIANGRSFDIAAIETLLYLMVFIEDSNLYHHSSKYDIELLKKEIFIFLTNDNDESTIINFVRQLNIKMSQNKISPGGSADLLAITIFCYYCEQNLAELFKN